ncbi:Protein of unknown function [Leuconostoc citreum]|nr:Protein of unknown function [Leuconostoc citreum]CDX66716.1 Protein of unknown function [Leuconostoc citreum]
MKGPAKYKT